MKDKYDNNAGMRAQQPASVISKKHSIYGNITNKVPVVVADRPLTVAYVKQATPEVIAELKQKYSYLNRDPYEITRTVIKEKALENTINTEKACKKRKTIKETPRRLATAANRLPNENNNT